MSLYRDIRELPRQAWILFAGTLLNRFGSFVLVFLVLYLTDAGFGEAQAGLAIGAYGLGSVFAAGVGGTLADRFGRRNTIVLSMLASAASLLAMAHATGFLVIVGLAAATGFTAEMYRPAASALLTDVTEGRQRLTAFAVYRLAINLGTGAGPAVGGILAERSFKLLFYADAITSVGFAIVASLLLANRVVGVTTHKTAGWSRVLADRYFLFFLGAALSASLLFMQAFSTIPLQVTANGWSPKIYGMLMAVNGFMILLMELPLTKWTGRFSPRRVIIWGYLIVGAGFALTGAPWGLAMLIASVAIWTVGEMIVAPTCAAYVSDVAPDDARGRYHGAWVMMWGVGNVIGPVVGTWTFARNPDLLWVMCGVIGVIAASLARVGVRATKPFGSQ